MVSDGKSPPPPARRRRSAGAKPAGFDEFYAASVRRVTSHLHAVTGSRAEAEDAVQEAYTRAWQRWGRVSGYGDPEAWVRTVAYRISVTSWRKAMRRRAAHRRQELPASEASLGPDYVAIVAALRKISAEQRQAIVLYHLVGLSVEEIARDTRVPAGTVKARLFRGRRALLPLLSDDPSEQSLRGRGVPSDV